MYHEFVCLAYFFKASSKTIERKLFACPISHCHISYSKTQKGFFDNFSGTTSHSRGRLCFSSSAQAS